MKDEKKIEKRSRIIEAAGRLFMEKGLNDTRMQDVADACEISKGSLYSYFPGKDELAAAWVNSIGRELLLSLETKLSGSPSAREKLTNYISFRLDMANNDKMTAIIRMITEKHCEITCLEENTLVREIIHRISGELKMLKDILNEGIESGEFNGSVNVNLNAVMIMGCISSYVFYTSSSNLAIGRFINELTDVVSLENTGSKQMTDYILKNLEC